MTDLQRSDRYQHLDPDDTAGTGTGIFGLDVTPEDARVVLLPVPFEATTSYGIGASKGPAAILKASHQVELFDLETGRPYRAGICMLPIDQRVEKRNEQACMLAALVQDAGGVEADEGLRADAAKVNHISSTLNRWVKGQVSKQLEAGKLVGLVGGDHATPFGAIAAHAERFPGMGILHIDAHADLREAYQGFTWSHASIMYNVLTRVPSVSKLVQVGIRDFCEAELAFMDASEGRVVPFFDACLQRKKQSGVPWTELVQGIIAKLPKQVYISLDIDGLDPKLCPHTGTPVPGGLDFPEVTALFSALVASDRRIVGFDLNEVAPGADGDEWDANVGARLLYKLIGFSLLSYGIGAPPHLPLALNPLG